MHYIIKKFALTFHFSECPSLALERVLKSLPKKLFLWPLLTDVSWNFFFHNGNQWTWKLILQKGGLDFRIRLRLYSFGNFLRPSSVTFSLGKPTAGGKEALSWQFWLRKNDCSSNTRLIFLCLLQISQGESFGSCLGKINGPPQA